MFDKLKLMCAAATISVMPMMASAVTVTVAPGAYEFNFFGLASGGTASYSYDTVGKVRVNVIAVSGTGFRDGNDLAKVRFGVNGATSAFSTITDLSPMVNSTASAIGSIASFVTNAPFKLDFTAFGTSKNTQLTYAFTVSQVPVPAAGLLMLGALAGLGAMRRRKLA